MEIVYIGLETQSLVYFVMKIYMKKIIYSLAVTGSLTEGGVMNICEKCGSTMPRYGPCYKCEHVVSVKYMYENNDLKIMGDVYLNAKDIKRYEVYNDEDDYMERELGKWVMFDDIKHIIKLYDIVKDKVVYSIEKCLDVCIGFEIEDDGNFICGLFNCHRGYPRRCQQCKDIFK